jgi:hypothetical protein
VPSIAFFVLAQRIIVDTATSAISVVDIVEQAQFPKSSFPNDPSLLNWMDLPAPGQIVIVWEWLSAASTKSLVAQQVVTATGRVCPIDFLSPFYIERPSVALDIPPRARSLWYLQTMPIDAPGRYELQIVVDGKVAASQPFFVNAYVEPLSPASNS